MNMKKFVSIILLAVTAIAVMAVPAKRDGFLRTAADGTKKMVYLHGNETFHYLTDADGNWLDEETLLPLSKERQTLRENAGQARIQAKRIQEKKKIGVGRNLAPRGLIILVNFSDKAFITPFDTINNMLNGENFTRSYKTTVTNTSGYPVQKTITCSGSAKKYFHDQSWGQYNPVFDVVGPVTVSQNVSYYGSNNSDGDDMNVDMMVKEACTLADTECNVDYSLYDNNNDGYVDFVYFLYAGYGEADGGASSTIWPHNYDYTYYYGNSTLKLDGKRIANYACSNELNYGSSNYTGIGTFCHEFSHVLGLPDLYATNSSTHHTLLSWDILDYGPYNNDGNTPPSYSAYERFYMGWLTPRVLTEPEYVWLNPLNGSQEALLITKTNVHNLQGDDPYPTDFYLLECRKKEGWDAYLPGKGMLITHIRFNADKWEGNTVNNNANSMGVDIIEAKENTTSGYSAKAKSTDAFPAGATEWTGLTDHEVTNITLQTGGAVTFSYRGAETNDVDNVPVEDVQSLKVLQNGQLFIIRNGVKYDITGKRLVIGNYEDNQL